MFISDSVLQYYEKLVVSWYRYHHSKMSANRFQYGAVGALEMITRSIWSGLGAIVGPTVWNSEAHVTWATELVVQREPGTEQTKVELEVLLMGCDYSQSFMSRPLPCDFQVNTRCRLKKQPSDWWAVAVKPQRWPCRVRSIAPAIPRSCATFPTPWFELRERVVPWYSLTEPADWNLVVRKGLPWLRETT